MEFVRTLAEIQPRLKSLYAGKDMIFAQLTCPNCSMLPLDPQECIKCQQPICKHCLNRNNSEGYCANCNTSQT